MLNNSNIENPIKNGILFIHAYNVQIRVSDNQLLIDYRNPVKGEKTRKTSLCLNRATSGLKQLIISGDDGYISLYALRWLAEIKASIIQIGFDNQLYLASSPSDIDRPALRRYQVLAAYTPLGANLARELLTAKIQGQISVMKSMDADTQPMNSLLQAIQECESPMDMMGYEGRASALYWIAWKNVAVNFAKKDQKNMPKHWGIFYRRASELDLHPRKAINPSNAMLNYLYAILKGETTTALQMVGLDPGIGILHSDNPSTPNLSLDVMETVRPSVDDWFLSFLKKRVFSKGEFFEMQDGSVRLSGQLRQELSAYGPNIFALAAPWAEKVAHSLEKAFKGKVTIGTPLTQKNRKNGRDFIRARTEKTARAPKIEQRCAKCGNPIPSNYVYCPNCSPERKEEVKKLFSQAGNKKLEEMHENGIFPAHGGEAARKRGDTQRERFEARKEWEEANPGKLETEKARFIKEIQPFLQNYSILEIQKACHCSPRYAWLIKNGERIPHPVFHKDLEKAIKKGVISG